MTPDDVTEETIRAAQGGDAEALWLVVDAHERAVWSIVHRAAPLASAEEREDLAQEARVALIQCLRDYRTDGSRGKLLTYAYAAMTNAVADERVRMSSAVSLEVTTVRRVQHALHKADDDEEAAWVHLDAETRPNKRVSRDLFTAILQSLNTPLRFDDPLSAGRPSGPTDEVVSLAEVIPDRSYDAGESFVRWERRELARWFLSHLNARESYALRAYYGIGMDMGGGSLGDNDTEVSAHLGLSSARQCQTLRKVRERALKKLRTVAQIHNITE